MSTKQNLQTLKGFRDFYPDDQAFQSWFYQNVKEVSESFGYQEYGGPTLEPLELYAAKSGEELVKKQAFTLKDKTGKILALRPEMTPTLARMVAQKAGSLVFPLRWFSYGSRFRYEQPQRGRGREFFQWDIDILGPENLEADAEIISIATAFYQKVGLLPSEVKIKVNDRLYLQERLGSIGIPENKIINIFKVIDQKTKVQKNTFDGMLKDQVLSKNQVNELYRTLDDKTGYKESAWLSRILDLIEKTGYGDYVEFDPTIVRGLDYYTRTVFESWDMKGRFRSIWGGGRYDNLTTDVGGKQRIPGVGFAMGDMVLEEILRANDKFPQLKRNKTAVLITLFDESFTDASLSLAKDLREQGINTEVYPDASARLDKQLKYADRKGIPYVAILGPEEVENGKATMKNMKTGKQKSVPLAKLPALLQD